MFLTVGNWGFQRAQKQVPYFSGFGLWAATAGKIGFKRQSLDKQKDPSLTKLGNWGLQRVQKQVPYFSRFCLGSYGWQNRF